MLDLYATPDEIIDEIQSYHPDTDITQLLFNANIKCRKYKGSIQPYQAAVLYHLASDYNYGQILEVGTGLGYSAFLIASAAPNAKIITLNPSNEELKWAKSSLAEFRNIQYVNMTSREWYDYQFYTGNFDFIFIDGNHKDIDFDLIWYNRLNPNGMIVFHDFSDIDSKSPCLPVYEKLSLFANENKPDVLVKDTINKFGMIGFVKK